MTSFTVTLTEAELDVVRLALGRMLDPKPVKVRRPAGTALPKPSKPPRLSTGARSKVELAWNAAVHMATAHPEERERRMEAARIAGEAFCMNGRYGRH